MSKNISNSVISAVIIGLATETGQEDAVFEVPAGGGKDCDESFKYVDEAINTYGVTREGIKNGFRISFK